MSSPHYASVAARLLRRVPPPAPPSATVDEAALLTIARALSARRKRQLRKRAGAAALTVAAAVALSLGLGDLRSSSARNAAEPRVSVNVVHGSGASVVDGARHRALHVGAAVAAGSRIETTPDGEAALHLSTGTVVGVGGKALLTLQWRGPEQRFVLEAGGLSAKVAKLGAGARFVVETPDAELEVRGTQFQVAVLDQAEACAPARTRLFVQEGTVEVRSSGRGVLVRAGEQWPEVCATLAAVREEESPPAPAPEPEGRGAAPGARRGVEAPVASATVGAAPERNRSGLVAQTELFAEASRAASRGEAAAALGKYEALIQAYPTSALAENAIAERMRLRRGAGARREAERYLRLYPGGFGSAEAKRILANP